MANTLIVLAHPGKNSLSHLFADDVRKTLDLRGVNVDMLDLYQDQFSPVLTQVEREAYYSDAPFLIGTSQYAERLSKADTLVLIFPTWWYGLPAILKGWIDRVFAPTIAFDHATNFRPIKPRLTNLKSIMVITTLGSPWWVDWFVLRRPVRRILKTAVFALCAPKAKFQMLSFYSAEKPASHYVKQFRRKLARSLNRKA
jgi:NAD(P)H dehydrogenase (quinone)